MSCEASIRPSKAPSSLGKRPRNISSSPLQVGSRGKKSGRSQKSALLSPKSSRFSPLILAHKVSALPWLVDGRATPHHRLVLTQSNSTCNNTCASCGTLPGSLRQSHLPLAYHTLPKDTTLVFGRGTWCHHPDTTKLPTLVNRRAESGGQAFNATCRGEVRFYTRRKDPPNSCPKTKFRACMYGHHL